MCILEILSAPPDIIYQFLLDPLGLPKIREIIGNGGAQYLNLIYYMSQTYVFYLHRQYLILRNMWFPYITYLTIYFQSSWMRYR